VDGRTPVVYGFVCFYIDYGYSLLFFYCFVDARRPIKVQLQQRACALPPNPNERGQTHRCDYVRVPVMMQGNVCYYKEDPYSLLRGSVMITPYSAVDWGALGLNRVQM
jgi:hypothetical protein